MDACDAVDIIAPTSIIMNCATSLFERVNMYLWKSHWQIQWMKQGACETCERIQYKIPGRTCGTFQSRIFSIEGSRLNPMFIEVHRLAQFNPRGTDVSVILDLMIHDIDIILSLVKSNVSYISANGVAVMSDTPDIANVRMEFDNGCVANLTSSRISMKKMRKMRLFQKDAYIGIDFLEKKTEIITLKQCTEIKMCSLLILKQTMVKKPLPLPVLP